MHCFERCGCAPGNPLSQDILNLYQEPDGTRKLLNYMLDNLAGEQLVSPTPNCLLEYFNHSSSSSSGFALCSVHPEQLPQRPWITLKERDQMIPTGGLSLLCEAKRRLPERIIILLHLKQNYRSLHSFLPIASNRISFHLFAIWGINSGVWKRVLSV